MLPIRITFAGCSTSSVMCRSSSSSRAASACCWAAASALVGTVPTGWPSGPTMTMCSSAGFSLMSLSLGVRG